MPGAPGNLMAGSPGYFNESMVDDALFRYGLQNDPMRQERIRQMREKMNLGRPMTVQTAAQNFPVSATNEPFMRMMAPYSIAYQQQQQEKNKGDRANFDNKFVY